MIQFIVTWGTGVIQLWLHLFFTSTFLDKRARSRGTIALWLTALPFLVALVNQLHIPVLNALAGATQYIIIALIVFETSWVYTLLFSAIIYSIYAFSEIAVVLVLAAMYDGQLNMDFFSRDSIMILCQSLGVLVGLTITMLIRAIVRKRKDEKKVPQNLAVILFPFTSLVTIYYITATITDIFPRERVTYFGVLLAIFVIAVNIASLIGNENVRKRYILQNEIDAMQHQEELTVGLLSQQDEHLKEMRAQAHDFKNHLICLRALVDDNASAESKSMNYIDELLQTVGGVEQFVDVRNEALRAILVNTVAACKAQGIDFRCRIDYSDFLFMSFSDISILFSNALNNAIEACAQRNNDSVPWIDFKVLRKGEMLFIQLSNTMYTEVKRKNGVLLSQKSQPENHGIGFKNMERVVQRHGGNLTVDYDESVFRLYINLPVIDVEG